MIPKSSALLEAKLDRQGKLSLVVRVLAWLWVYDKGHGWYNVQATTVAQWSGALAETPSMLPKLPIPTPHLQHELTDALLVGTVNAR